MIKRGSLWVLALGVVVLTLPALTCGFPSQAVPTTTLQAEILFQDDFSDPTSGRDRRQDRNKSTRH